MSSKQGNTWILFDFEFIGEVNLQRYKNKEIQIDDFTGQAVRAHSY